MTVQSYRVTNPFDRFTDVSRPRRRSTSFARVINRRTSEGGAKGKGLHLRNVFLLNAGLLSGQSLTMKPDPEKKPHINNNKKASQAIFPTIGSPAAASLSLLTQHNLLVASQTAAFMQAAGLHASLSRNPSLYHHNIFANWVPPSPPPSTVLQYPSTPRSPTMATRATTTGTQQQSPSSTITSAGSGGGSNNNNKNTNNNNNSSIANDNDRTGKKNQPAKRKPAKPKAYTAPTPPAEAATSASPVPTISPPEAGKDSKDKVFTCGVCSRSFGYKHVLQNHERTHTGEKPFECQECHKK